MGFKVKNVFITGGNRGLGLGLTKAILAQLKPDHLFATYRSPSNSQELLGLANHNQNLHPVQFDVTDYRKLPGIVKEVDHVTHGHGINLLINNSGILGHGHDIRDVTREDLLAHLEINTLGPIMITQAFVPLLEKASTSTSANEPVGIRRGAVVNITSEAASIGNNESGAMFSYRVTKTALNMATKCISVDLQSSGIITVLIHPGWVKTDMGSQRAPLEIHVSAEQIIQTLKSLTAQDNGKFLTYNGKELPW